MLDQPPPAITQITLTNENPIIPNSPLRNSPEPQRKHILLPPSRTRDRNSRPGKCYMSPLTSAKTIRLPRLLSHFGELCETRTSVLVCIPGFGR